MQEYNSVRDTGITILRCKDDYDEFCSFTYSPPAPPPLYPCLVVSVQLDAFHGRHVYMLGKEVAHLSTNVAALEELRLRAEKKKCVLKTAKTLEVLHEAVGAWGILTGKDTKEATDE